MQKSCAAIPALWDYSFNIEIKESGWLKVPIATFASDYNGECRIFVQYQEYMFDGSATTNRITLGNMFFQSVYYIQGAGTISMSINQNTVGTKLEPWFGPDFDFEIGADPFLSEPGSIGSISNDTEVIGAYFAASMEGFTTEVAPYFHIDMTNPKTVVWGTGCEMHGVFDIECYYSPTTSAIETFTNMEFSGYLVSGSIYLDEICFDKHCMTTIVYVAYEIFSDS